MNNEAPIQVEEQLSLYDKVWMSAISRDDVVKALSQMQYPDAWLRDLAGSWVICDRSLVTLPGSGTQEQEEPYAILLGFLYVHLAEGFRLRVHGELTPSAPKSNRVYDYRQLDRFEWELNYDQLKKLPFRQFKHWEAQGLNLPPFPVRVVRAGHLNRAISHCRRIEALDLLRRPGHPDIVSAWIKVGDNPRGAQIQVLLEQEDSEGCFSGRLVSECKTGKAIGDPVQVSLFELEGKLGLFRMDNLLRSSPGSW